MRAKSPGTNTTEAKVEKMKQRDEYLKMMEKERQKNRDNDLMSELMEWTERKLLMHNVHNEVGHYLKTVELDLEQRRDRLRDMLRHEEREYMAAIEAAKETTLERRARLREQAKCLRERREKARLQVVQEKLDQQFREQCEELRSIMSKLEEGNLCTGRLDQLREKVEEAKRKKAENDMFAQLWEKDRQEKMAREEREAKETREKNSKQMDGLNKQLAAQEAQREEAKRLKDEEMKLMKEQEAQQKEDNVAAAEEKRRQQQERHDMLDQCLKKKNMKKAREEQEEQAFELKLLDQHLEGTRQEAHDELQRKRDLLEEDRRYREYLAQLAKEEKQKEKEREEFLNKEREAEWQKRCQEYKREQDMRRKLLNDVIAERQQQIQERLAENKRLQANDVKERMELCKLIEENLQYDKQQAAERKAKAVRYQSDLQDQIDYSNQIQEEQRRYDEYEYQMGLQAEKEYQEKLRNTLDNSSFDRLHPIRRAILNCPCNTQDKTRHDSKPEEQQNNNIRHLLSMQTGRDQEEKTKNSLDGDLFDSHRGTVKFQSNLQTQNHHSEQQLEQQNNMYEQQMDVQAEKQHREKLENIFGSPMFDQLHPVRRSMLI